MTEHLTRADLDRPFDERMSFLLKAPIIVVGTVVAVDEIGPPRTTQFDSRVRVQLNEISLNTEQVVRGAVQRAPLKFYYYTFSNASSVDLRTYHDYLTRGSHRVFFLEKTGTFYRSVGDVLEYTIPVLSGRHPPGFCPTNIPPGCCIARMIMTPTRDMGETFASLLGETWGYAKAFCSEQEGDALLRALADSSNETVAERARYYLRSIRRDDAH